MVHWVFLQIIFHLFLNNFVPIYANSDSIEKRYKQSEELISDSNHEEFAFKDSGDYVQKLHQLEAKMGAYMKLADVESNLQEIHLNWRTEQLAFDDNLEKELFDGWKSEFETAQIDVLLDKIWQLGLKLRNEISGFQARWSVPSVALTHKLEGEEEAKTVVLANSAFDKHRLEFEKHLAKIVEEKGQTLPNPVAGPFTTPEGYYTELVYTYNMASALLRFLADFAKKNDKSTSSSLLNGDMVYDSSCELNVGVPLPNAENLLHEIGEDVTKDPSKCDFDKLFKYGMKLLDMLQLLAGKKDEMIALARKHGVSPLDNLIEEAWEKYEKCKMVDGKSLKQNTEMLGLTF